MVNFYKTSIENCDVLDKQKLSQFRLKFELWSKWIGREPDNKIRKNSIWHQCLEMLNNEFTFQSLNLTGIATSQKGDFQDFFCSNPTVQRFITDGYFSFQYLAIRRLIDLNPKNDKKNEKGVKSLRRLVNDIKENSPLITREIFVCYDGFPYEYKNALEKENQKIWEDAREGATWMVTSDAQHAKWRHEKFDAITGISPNLRQRGDLIPLNYWDSLESGFEADVIRNIKNYVDKYLAHAADDLSIASLVQDDMVLSIEKIKKCQDILFSILRKTQLDLWDSSLVLTPTFSSTFFTFNLDKPFAPESIVNEVSEVINNRIDNLLNGM